MLVTSIILLGFAPGIFWLWYFYRKDRWEPEPKHLVIKTFFWGFAAAGVAALIEIPFVAFRLFSLTILAPIIEEAVKFSVVRFTIYKNAEFDEPMDGITYAAAAALGFASIENSFYLLGSYGFPFGDFVAQEPSHYTGGLFPLFTVRALLSVPGHVLFSSMWGYALGWSKFMNKSVQLRFVGQGIVLAIVFHSAFNSLAVFSSYGYLALLIFVPVMWKIVGKRIHLALAASPHIKNTPDTIS